MSASRLWAIPLMALLAQNAAAIEESNTKALPILAGVAMPLISEVLGALLRNKASALAASAGLQHCSLAAINATAIPQVLQAQAQSMGCQLASQAVQTGVQSLGGMVSSVLPAPTDWPARLLSGIAGAALGTGDTLMPTGGNALPPAAGVAGYQYQGFRMEVVLVDRQGAVLGYRALDRGFVSGELFRLRIQPSFDSVLELDAVNPRGERQRMFPAVGVQMQIRAGAVLELPEGAKAFAFGGNTGREQLIVRLRDPALAADPAPRQVFRQDAGQATNYLQAVPAGERPYIAHAIEVIHRAQ